MRPRSPRGSERGLSLVELLVAVTVMAIAGSIALFLYDVSRRSFQKGENATEQQQAVRIAFDKLSTDVRLAGFDVNPDGAPEFPDDAIEGAFDTAIVLRANYDAEDPAESLDPETLLAGGAHRAVSVGNDEIVAYVLAKPDGSSPDTLVFDADVREAPRDGVPETVSIPNVALVQDDPPYTLYRITLHDDPTTWGTAGFVVRTPLVEHVRSMTFRYHGPAGQTLNPVFDLATVADDLGGADLPASRRRRGVIRRIQIQLEGLTRDPDLGWADVADPNPSTRAYRKFRLRGDVTPRNMGKKGLLDAGWDVTPPSPPAAPVLVAGHCGGLWVEWPPNPPSENVVAYRVLSVAADGTGRKQRMLGTTGFFLDGLVNNFTYRVRVQAVDAAGNWSLPSDERTVEARDDNVPEAPDARYVSGTTDLPGRIRLTWRPVERNTDSVPAGDPAAPAIRDLEGYEIWRGTNDTSGSSDVIIAEPSMVRAVPSPAFDDSTVVPCRTYYYRVRAYDHCGLNNETGYRAPGRATATAPPAVPAGVEAQRSGSGVNVVWEPVGRDASGNPSFSDRYHVYRDLLRIGDPAPECGVANFRGTATATHYLDDTPPAVGPGEQLLYRVRATNDCGTNEISDCSAGGAPGCSFSGTVTVVKPPAGLNASPVDLEVRVDGGTDTYVEARVRVLREEDGTVRDLMIPGPGPVWRSVWTESTPGTYLVKASVENAAGCTSFSAVRVRLGS